MCKRLILSVAMLLAFACSYSQQSGEEAAVTEVIIKLFKGMQTGDSALVRSIFANEVTMATAFRTKENEPVLRRESSIKDFLVAVGTPRKEVWYEEIWNMKIQIDGDLAQGWCDYAFYIDNTFSHCGVDAFQLHKGKNGWKIFHLADTRKKTGCSIPQDVQKKHK